jgi:hypothetical protein
VADKKKRLNALSNKFKVLLVVAYSVLTWIGVTLASIPFISSIHMNEAKTGCSSAWSDQSITIYFTIKFGLIFLLPSIVITISSLKLLIFLNEWKKTNEKLLCFNNTKEFIEIKVLKKFLGKMCLKLDFLNKIKNKLN